MRRRGITPRVILRYLLTFVLMLSIMGISIMAFGKYSMLSEHGIIHTCDRISYFEDICEEMGEQAYYMGLPYGLNKKSVKGIFSESQVRNDVIRVVKSQIKGHRPVIDSVDISDRIKSNVIKQKGKLNSVQLKSLDSYISKVQKMYQEKLFIPGMEHIANAVIISDKIVILGIPILIIIAILCIFYLISSRRTAYRGIRYVSYGFLGAGVTLLTIFSAMISDGFIYKFNISDVYMRKFFTFWIGHEMLMQVFAGIGLTFVGMVIVYLVIRQKARER